MYEFLTGVIDSAKERIRRYFQKTEVQDFLMWCFVYGFLAVILIFGVVPWLIGLGMYVYWIF